MSWFCALLLYYFDCLTMHQSKQLFLLASTQLGLCLSSFSPASNLTTDLVRASSAQWNMNLGHWTWVSQAKATRPVLSLSIGYPYKCIKQCQNRIWFVGIFAGAYDILHKGIRIGRLSCLVASCSRWSDHWLNGSIELGTKVNQHRPGWMLCRQKTLFHCIPVP